MNVKKALRIGLEAGFQKNQNYPMKVVQFSHQKKQEPQPKRKVPVWQIVAVAIAVGFWSVSFHSHFSTLQLILIAVALSVAVPWVLVRRTFHKTVSKILKYTLISSLIFVIAFVSTGSCLFYTSGYPPSYVPQISYSNILGASLTECLQSVEQSASFNFLQVEHLGTIEFEYLTMNMYDAGNSWLSWRFYAKDTTVRLLMGGLPGTPYKTSVQSPFLWSDMQLNFYSLQSLKQSFEQIDALGLNWFFNQAVSAYQKDRGNLPELSAISVDISIYNDHNYQGLTITLTSRTSNNANLGYRVSPVVFTAGFQPNGTLLWITFSD